jgi:hypothetical protein
LARGVYRSSYAVSYGVVFPIILVARFIPENNSLIYGVIDGSQAAIDSVERIKAARESGASNEEKGTQLVSPNTPAKSAELPFFSRANMN